jgi:hypothetical protein
LRPQPNPLALSLSLRARPESSANVDCRPFCDRRRARALSVASVSFALSSATQDTLWFALPLSGLPDPRSPEHFLRSRSTVAVDPRLHRTLSFSKRLRVRTRGEHPFHAFISPSIAPEPAQLLIGVSCAAAGLFPPRSAFSGAPVPVMRPWLCSPCRPERASPFPYAPRASSWLPPRLQRALAVGPSGATALMSGPRPLDLERPSEIGRFRL